MTVPGRGRLLIGTLTALVVAVGLVGCGDDDGVGAEQARVDVDGSITVEREDGTSETRTGDVTLAFGDIVTVDDGTATVAFAGGQIYELRSEPSPSVLEIGAPPTILEGAVLVADGYPAQIRHDVTTVSAQGPLKVLADVPGAVSYIGVARIDGAGPLDRLDPLWEVVLTPSAEQEPLTYDGSDRWDRRFLGEAVAFGERLEALARGYTADLGPGGGRSVSFFESVLPQLAAEPEFGADLLADRPAGETLVGAAIAVQGQDGTFRDRWDQVFAFRDAGAAWGLVALAHGVSTAPLLDTIELAVTGPVGTNPPSSSTTEQTDPDDTTTTSATSPPTSDTSTPTTTPGDSNPPTTQPSPGLLEPLLDPVGEIVNDLLEALGL